MFSSVEEYQGVETAAKDFENNPKLFFKNILGVETLEFYQEKVLEKIWDNDRTCIAACHDVGKSFLMARVAMAFLNIHPNSKVITTAPTFLQVERILWSEIRAAHKKAKFPLGGKLNLTDWSFSPDWFAIGFTPRNELTGGEGQGTQSSFQGFHAEHLLVIFDEATGIPVNVWNMVEGLMTSAHVKFVAIGNPTSQASEFYRCFRSKDWAKVYLSCFDSPNLIANGITNKDKLIKEVEKYKSLPDSKALAHLNAYKVVRPYLLTTKWVVQQCARWGIEHPLTVSKILGKFPVAGDKTLVPLGFVEDAMRRVYQPTVSDRKVIGVDVARFGTDSTVLTAMHGKQQLKRIEIFKRKTQEVSGEAVALAREIGGADVIVVDETGLGGGVVDLLTEEIGQALHKNCEVRGVQFGAACEIEEDKEKYVNLKARMFGLLQADMKAEDGLALLGGESVYLEEMPSILYTYDKKGRMQIESKDDYKKRTGRGSPDSTDSLALANYGRYDEMKIGKFPSTKTDNANPRRSTHAGSLRNERKW